MKRAMIIVLSVVTLAYPAMAEGEEICHMIADSAENIMTLRQTGIIPMEKYLETIRLSGVSAQDTRVAEAVVRHAYNYPLYKSERAKKRAIKKFRDRYYKECIEIRKK